VNAITGVGRQAAKLAGIDHHAGTIPSSRRWPAADDRAGDEAAEEIARRLGVDPARLAPPRMRRTRRLRRS